MNRYHQFLTENYLNNFSTGIPYFENVKSEFGKARLSVWKKDDLWAIVIEEVVYSYGNAIRNWTYSYGNALKRRKIVETFANVLSAESNSKLINQEYDCDLASLIDIETRRGSILQLPLDPKFYSSYFKYDIDPYPNKINLRKIFFYLVENNSKDMFSSKDEINKLFSSDLEMVAFTDEWYYEELGITYWEKAPSEIDFINQSIEILLGNKQQFSFEKTNSSWYDY
jgi:hypothetical protein